MASTGSSATSKSRTADIKLIGKTSTTLPQSRRTHWTWQISAQGSGDDRLTPSRELEAAVAKELKAAGASAGRRDEQNVKRDHELRAGASSTPAMWRHMAAEEEGEVVSDEIVTGISQLSIDSRPPGPRMSKEQGEIEHELARR